MEKIEIQKMSDVAKAGWGACRMKESDYHADPCPGISLSSSIVKVLLDARPAHAWQIHPRLNSDWKPNKANLAMSMGSVCHRLFLGAGSELIEINADNYRKKEAQTKRDNATRSGCVPVLSRQLAEAQEIVREARAQLVEMELDMEAGDSEVVVAYEDPSGGWFRCMLDWWSNDRRMIVDYKTTERLASASSFARHACQMGYDIQDAFYQYVVGAAFSQLAGRLQFVFLVQEINPPYALAAYEIAEADRTVATRKVAHAVNIWFECLRKNSWPGYPRVVQRISLPDWHHRQWLEREMGEEGNG
jgi:hypothetical protein